MEADQQTDITVDGHKVLLVGAGPHGAGLVRMDIVGLDPLPSEYRGGLSSMYAWKLMRYLMEDKGAVWHLFDYPPMLSQPRAYMPRIYLQGPEELRARNKAMVVPVQVYGTGFNSQPNVFNDPKCEESEFTLDFEDLEQLIVEDAIALYARPAQDYEAAAEQLILDMMRWGLRQDIQAMPSWEEIALRSFKILCHSAFDGNGVTIYTFLEQTEHVFALINKVAADIWEFCARDCGKWEWSDEQQHLVR